MIAAAGATGTGAQGEPLSVVQNDGGDDDAAIA